MTGADSVDVVLVYGSLMIGEPLHGWLEESELINGNAYTQESFSMYSMGEFPAARRQPAVSPIAGETYRVSLSTLRRLDRVEGHPRFCQRELVELAGGGVAWCYLQPCEKSPLVVIPDCDWRAWRARQERWLRCQ